MSSDERDQQQIELNEAAAQPTTGDEAAPEQDDLSGLMQRTDAEFFDVFDDLYDNKVWAGGAIPAKYKELSGVTLSVVVRCKECLRYHIEMCLKENVTKQEFIEAIRLGVMTGGSITIPTARYGYELPHEKEVV